MVSTVQCVEYFVVLVHCRIVVVISSLRRETSASTDPQTVALARPDDVLWSLHRLLLERLEGERKKYVDELAESLILASLGARGGQVFDRSWLIEEERESDGETHIVQKVNPASKAALRISKKQRMLSLSMLPNDRRSCLSQV